MGLDFGGLTVQRGEFLLVITIGAISGTTMNFHAFSLEIGMWSKTTL